MEKQPSNFLAEISDTDWEKTPESVKRLVGQLLERLAALEERQEHLEEQLKRNSQNSSQPPSQDVLPGFKPKPKEQGKKRRGGQPGHEGHLQRLYAPEECAAIEEHDPSHCCGCGEALSGFDAAPQRCQSIEMPPLHPIVVEHRFHALACPRCGVRTRAYDAAVVDGSRYGDRLCALVGLLSGEYRQSHRMVVRLLAEIFEIEMSVGSVGRLRQAMSEAVAVPVTEAHQYVQHQARVSVDETSFQQGNADGANPTGRTGWLWVIVTPLVCYFQVLLSRSGAAAQTILGSQFAGYVNSDRYSAYTWLAMEPVVLGIEMGAADYMTRPFQSLLLRTKVTACVEQKRLRDHHGNFGSLLENAPVGVYQATAEGHFKCVNSSLVQLLGYPAAVTLIETVTDITHQVYVDLSRYAEFKCLLEEHDHVTGFEYQAYRHDGDIIWVSEHARAVRDPSGQLVYYEGIVEEITQRKLAEADLKQQLTALQRELEQIQHAQQVAEIVQTDYFQQLQLNGEASGCQDSQQQATLPLKVLLVEDNELNCDMLSRRLQRSGYTVVIANDGADGVTKALSEQPISS